MVTVVVVVVCAVALLGAGLAIARRRAAERARVEHERRVIARDLEGHLQERDANVSRAGQVSAEVREHRAAAEQHEEEARRHEREARAHAEEVQRLEARFHRAQGAAARHGDQAADAEQRLQELGDER